VNISLPNIISQILSFLFKLLLYTSWYFTRLHHWTQSKENQSCCLFDSFPSKQTEARTGLFPKTLFRSVGKWSVLPPVERFYETWFSGVVLGVDSKSGCWSGVRWGVFKLYRGIGCKCYQWSNDNALTLAFIDSSIICMLLKIGAILENNCVEFIGRGCLRD